MTNKPTEYELLNPLHKCDWCGSIYPFKDPQGPQVNETETAPDNRIICSDCCIKEHGFSFHSTLDYQIYTEKAGK